MSTGEAVHSSAPVALRELILAAESFRQAVAGQLGVSINESIAVSYLHSRGPLGQTDLADLLGITTSSTTSLIDRLSANGLVERQPHPEDRRRSTVVLTDRGRDVVAWGGQWFDHAADDVPPADRPVVIAGLLSISERLRTYAGEVPTHHDGPLEPVAVAGGNPLAR
ncbi:MAG: MarR family winged helix-turn-helix transcriptional regulator [bacterium]